MQTLGVQWVVAGGRAIDLWLGTRTREHHEVAVVVRRQAQTVVHGGLRDDFELHRRSDNRWLPCGDGEPIVALSFQLETHRSPTEFDIFLESIIGRHLDIAGTHESGAGSTSLSPSTSSELPWCRHLLYKSDETKTRHAFEMVLPRLTNEAASWLRETLAMLYPLHPWLAQRS